MSELKHHYVSWEDYHGLIEQLALRVHQSNWRPDQIVCIARGGLRVGDQLSRMFDLPLAIMSTSMYREAGGTQAGQLVMSEHMTMTTEALGKHVLVVDDMVDSGHTLKVVHQELPQRYPHIQTMRTGVLWKKACTRFEPDYFVHFLADNPWIHQPFENYEDMRPEMVQDDLRYR